MSNSHPYDEKALLASVAEGDESAFGQLFRHWSQVLAAYIFQITESRELTEEIVQDAFIKIWMIRETMTGVNNFKHFILVISRNKAFDAMKKQLREKELRKAWEKTIGSEWSATDSEDEALKYSLIERAINGLPARRKEVFKLSRHQFLSYQEIAAQLNISPESVKTHIRLASNSISNYIRANWAEFALLAISLKKIL